MEKWITLIAATTLAACSQTAEDPPDPIEPEQAVTPGIYDFISSEGGATNRAVLAEDGTYRSYDASGAETGAGTWTNVGQRTCFEPSTGADPVCYTDDPAGEDGSFTARSDDGRVITVRPVDPALAEGDDSG